MTLRALVLMLLAAAVVAGGSGYAALKLTELVEARSVRVVESTLAATGAGWADVSADGLQVVLGGEAPSEAARAEVVATVEALLEPGRVVPAMTVAEAPPAAPPDFHLEMLRSGDRLSVMGLIPDDGGRREVRTALGLLGPLAVTDLSETAPGTEPRLWAQSLGFAGSVIAELPRAHVEVRPGEVRIAAVAETPERRAEIEATLAARLPRDVRMVLELRAPRQVITPFLLTAVIEPDGQAALPNCSAGSEEGRDRILEAAARLGIRADCAVGLGAPSPAWADAAVAVLDALADLGPGAVEIVNADVALTGAPGSDAERFQQIEAALAARLPEDFSLHAVLPLLPETTAVGQVAAPGFRAVRSADGTVRLAGDVQDEMARMAAQTFAEAKFGFNTVVNEAVVRSGLPSGWPARVFTGLEGLARLRTGTLEVGPGRLALTGISTDEALEAELAAYFAESLPAEFAVDLSVRYDATLAAQDRAMEPEDCAERVTAAMADGGINFDPSSSEIDADSQPVLDALAEVLGDCAGARFEVAGHTDSQGRESSNMALSQARAEAVVGALLNRGLALVYLEGRGYGESEPIADNETEEGRALNRRIEFRLMDRPEERAAPDEEPLGVPEDVVQTAQPPAEEDADDGD